MATSTHPEEPPESGTTDRSEFTRWERFNSAVRRFEAREDELMARLHVRRQNATELRQTLRELFDAVEKEYRATRADLQHQIKNAEFDVNAAQLSAGRHCSEIGIPYVPGQTMEADVLRVPALADADAAHSLDLPFGVGLSDGRVKLLKPVLMVFCWLASSLSLGLLFHLLEVRRLFISLPMLAVSLIIGGVVATGLNITITALWRPIGVKTGSRRTRTEVLRVLVPVALITGTFFLSLVVLDAKALILLNAARAALNPIFAIPLGVGLFIGTILSGVYIVGLAGTAFAAGYDDAAKKSISAMIAADEQVKLEAAKKKVAVRLTLDALAQVKVTQAAIKSLKDSLKLADQEYSRERNSLVEALPKIPASLEDAELQELTDLRDRSDSAKIEYDAHVLSRSGSLPAHHVETADS